MFIDLISKSCVNIFSNFYHFIDCNNDLSIFMTYLTVIFASYSVGRVCIPLVIHCKTEKEKKKQRGWILTLISSCVCGLQGFYFLGRVTKYGFRHEFSRDETLIDRHYAIFFIAYCIADLVTGTFDYIDDIDYQGGWKHHLFYGVGLLYLLYRKNTHFFTAGLIEEVPTIVLSWERIRHTKELNWNFALLYFLLRILYHVVATFEVLEHSMSSFCIGLIILRQHLWWLGIWWRRSSANAHSAGPQLNRFKNNNSQLKLHTKLFICATMVFTQSATMLHVTFEGYGRRDWVNETIVLIGLVTAWIYFSYEAMLIFVDTYTRGFIEMAIKEKKVIYNISWEDPRVEREELKLSQDDIVLTISSAGCNVLDYLIEKPKHITAVDLNEAQLAVLDLKLACIASKMPQTDFFALWGRSDPRIFTEYYNSKLRPLLRRNTSRHYWDSNKDDLFRDNWMFCGTSGLMAFIFMLIARPLGISSALQRNLRFDHLKRGVVHKLLNLGTWILEKQFIWTYVAPLGGIPPKQLALVSRRPRVFSDRIREILSVRMWSHDNYFYHGYCTGQFDNYPKCPRYMSVEHYPTLLSMDDVELRERVTLFHGSWGDALPPDCGTDGFTFVSLLDSMDWMPPDLVATLLKDMLGRCNREKCRLFWRSFSPGSMLQEKNSDLFTVHSPALSQIPHKEIYSYDRVGWYLSQWTATIPKNIDLKAFCPTGLNSNYKNTFMDDILICISMLKQAIRTKKDVTTFYKNQATRYDGFRESLLPDRDTFLKYTVPWSQVQDILINKKPKYALVCIGCGTARDIEFIADYIKNLPKSARVALCDLSPELLMQAKLRIDRLGLTEKIDLIECDITESTDVLSMCGLNQNDAAVVTCSYCLTMIPQWRKAIDRMLDLLVQGGTLCLIDFTQRFDKETSFIENIYKAWFSLDGVYLNRKHVNYISSKTNPLYYSESRARVPYTILYPTHYSFTGHKR